MQSPCEALAAEGRASGQNCVIQKNFTLGTFRPLNEGVCTVKRRHSCIARVHLFCRCRNASANDLSSRTYELDIHFVEQDKKCLIKFPGSKTIRQACAILIWVTSGQEFCCENLNVDPQKSSVVSP